MPSATASTPLRPLGRAAAEPLSATVRPAVVALLLLAAVALTGVLLYVFWPLGVATGLAIGAVAVLAIGARMQVVARVQPTDQELAARLGIESLDLDLDSDPEPSQPEIAPVADDRATAADHEVDEAEALPAQPEVLYFTSDDDPDRAEARVLTGDPVRSDLDELKAQLGDDYLDFARAARLVVSTQYASAARLQRDLDLSYARARRLLTDLEEQHFVGPATGSLPRQVLMPKDRLPEVERLLAEV